MPARAATGVMFAPRLEPMIEANVAALASSGGTDSTTDTKNTDIGMLLSRLADIVELSPNIAVTSLVLLPDNPSR